MSRFARTRRVFFVEEPVFEDAVTPHLRSSVCPDTGVHVKTPVLPAGLDRQAIVGHQQKLLGKLLDGDVISNYVTWYYTPMAREFARGLRPMATVYDCMDELSCFAGAPPAMRANELELFEAADLVFTGGATLYASKRKQHSSVHLFPSSVDVTHFARALSIQNEPADQAHLPKPRLGYAGVIDERMDLDLLRHIASERPNWQIVLLGPVAKIDPDSLPRAANIHYLGLKHYADLPAYFSGWQIGMLPFAINESTRFISPTKTPEYLAAGLKVVSTPVHDVITPYGDLGLVGIAQNPREFLRIADVFLASSINNEFRMRADKFLSQSSWDKTWSKMNELVSDVILRNQSEPAQALPAASKGLAHV